MVPDLPDALHAHVHAEALSLYTLDGLDLRFDGEGRWRSMALRGPLVQRTLDGNVAVRRRGESIRFLGATEVDDIHEAVRGRLIDFARRLDTGAARLEPASPTMDLDAALAILDRALTWDADRFAVEQRTYRRVYSPVGILPPDRYRNVVFQASIGCPWNRCTFCTFYRDRRYQVLAPHVFAEHVRSVIDLFGRGLSLRRGVFIGDANALAIPNARLQDILHEVSSLLGEQAQDGCAPAQPDDIGAFLDPHHAPRRTAADFEAIAQAGLRYVSVGLETGSAEVLKRLGKGDAPDRVIDAVREARAGGLRVSVMILCGIDDDGTHGPRTIRAIQAMALGHNDIVYLSPLAGAPDGPRRVDEMYSRLRDVTAAKIAPYRMDEFQYYA